MTQEQYVGMATGLFPLLKKSPGFIAHAGGPIPGGWQVTEIWESQEQHDAWMKGTVMPAMRAGGGATPNVLIQQVHTVVTP
jgi:hypothetical protein